MGPRGRGGGRYKGAAGTPMVRCGKREEGEGLPEWRESRGGISEERRYRERSGGRGGTGLGVIRYGRGQI